MYVKREDICKCFNKSWNFTNTPKETFYTYKYDKYSEQFIIRVTDLSYLQNKFNYCVIMEFFIVN